MPFSRQSLENAGFVGWIPLSALGGTSCPTASGTYLIFYPGGEPPAFLQASPGGWLRGRDPTVELSALHNNWVTGAQIIYVGLSSNLQARLRQLVEFGGGKPVRHWGGRLIWQIQKPDQLLVAWNVMRRDSIEAAKKDLIAQFISIYRKPPFANDPHRNGR